MARVAAPQEKSLVRIRVAVRASGPATASRQRGPRPARGRPTTERILDAAEKLFARRGFYGVSVRDITQQAGVDRALVNYHFGSKQEPSDRVLARRAEIRNAERMQRLRACIEKARPALAQLDGIIDALTQPLRNRSDRGNAGWKAWFALIAQVDDSTELGGVIMTKYFDPVVRRFVDALRQTLPDSDPRDIYGSYHLLFCALTLTFAETGRIDNLSSGLCHSADLDSVHERVVPSGAAGSRALCAQGAAQRGAATKTTLTASAPKHRPKATRKSR